MSNSEVTEEKAYLCGVKQRKQKMSVKVSIIMPVYNAAEFLERGIGSIINQSEKSWELLCVDDGSTDSSPQILSGLSGKEARIKVITQANAGVSAARNAALQQCSGEYVAFVDSDDFLHPQALEICLEAARRDSSDLVAFTYDRSYRTRTILRHFLGLSDRKTLRFKTFTHEQRRGLKCSDIYSYVSEYSGAKNPAGSKQWAVKHCQPWRCLYRRETVQDIRFIPGIIYEDFPWWGEVLLKVRRATILNLPLYFYYPNRGSYILSSRQEYRIRSLEVALEAAEKVYADAPQRKKEIWQEYFITPFREKLDKKKRRLYGKDTKDSA